MAIREGLRKIKAWFPFSQQASENRSKNTMLSPENDSFNNRWGKDALNTFTSYTYAINEYNLNAINKQTFLEKQDQFLKKIPKEKHQAFLKDMRAVHLTQYNEFRNQKRIWRDKKNSSSAPNSPDREKSPLPK